MNIDELLQHTIDNNASDLHITSGAPPIIRVDGDLQAMEHETLDENATLEMIKHVTTEQQLQAFHDELEIDFGYALTNKSRFRVNAFHHYKGYAAAFRPIPWEIPTIDQMGLPDSFKAFCQYPNGLILVTGPTGSGKSTTLAAMINDINEHQYKHIITVEDPIEFLHTNRNCLIVQRELNRDTKSFNLSLRSALREDPDIILIGEMRDLETIRLALTAAETGHLVFATVHTNSAATTIDRVVDVFPEGEKDMIRTMLSQSLRTVISQTLIKRKEGGRIAALEVLICTPAIANLIRENKIPQIYSAMQAGQEKGMHTRDQHITKLLEQELIAVP